MEIAYRCHKVKLHIFIFLFLCVARCDGAPEEEKGNVEKEKEGGVKPGVRGLAPGKNCVFVAF